MAASAADLSAAGRPLHRTCLSPHKHALSIDDEAMAGWCDTIVTELLERRPLGDVWYRGPPPPHH
jgi:hypothetical protein